MVGPTTQAVKLLGNSAVAQKLRNEPTAMGTGISQSTPNDA